MQSNPTFPTVTDVERITKVSDPVIRNLQITQCYYELSVVLASQTGLSANWCTFATWASKQAGQTIRKEDLSRLLERRLVQSPAAMQATRGVAAHINSPDKNQFLGPQGLALQVKSFTSAIDRASDAVSRGNKKVFEEIGHAFALFYQTCLFQQQPGQQELSRFCEMLREGDPPDGQGYLRHAFTHYARALAEPDAKTRAELILMANIEIGFHEQTRLQPEIAESLDAGFTTFFEFARALFRSVFPANGWFHLAHLYLRRLLGRPTALDMAIQALLAEVQAQLRQVVTEVMMTIALPSGVVLRLGRDLAEEFPETLKQITNPELVRFLKEHDLTPDSLGRTGANDWADLPERLHFIIDLFRCYQERASLFDPPFTPEQMRALKENSLPGGRL